jgi:N-methylhydantoinase A
MANAMREVSVRKGYDPSDFLFLAYGGTIGMFASQIAASIGVRETVIPRNSSVFCAEGLLSSDTVLRYDRSVSWRLDDPDEIKRVNGVAEEMLRQALNDLRAEGIDPGDERVSVTRSGDFQFAGQVYELTIPLPDSLEVSDIPVLADRFVELYEEAYGVGTAWRGVTPILLNYTVVVRASRDRPELVVEQPSVLTLEKMTKGQRSVYLPSVGEYAMTNIIDDELFGFGNEIAGPAIVDANDTTIFVPPDVIVARDEFLNYRLRTTVGH